MYPIFGNWVWGGGWLARSAPILVSATAIVDFGGSSVVHMQGGVIGLIFAWLLARVYGKYIRTGAQPHARDSIPMAMVGTFILVRLVRVQIRFHSCGDRICASRGRGNTMLASATVSVAGDSMDVVGADPKKPDPCHDVQRHARWPGCHHLSCAFRQRRLARHPWRVAECFRSRVRFLFDKRKIDDPVGAISVHGVCAPGVLISWSLRTTALMVTVGTASAARCRGLFYGGAGGQFLGLKSSAWRFASSRSEWSRLSVFKIVEAIGPATVSAKTWRSKIETTPSVTSKSHADDFSPELAPAAAVEQTSDRAGDAVPTVTISAVAKRQEISTPRRHRRPCTEMARPDRHLTLVEKKTDSTTSTPATRQGWTRHRR